MQELLSVETARPPFAYKHEAVLAGLVGAEILTFAVLGRNFFTADNGFEIVRICAEIGLLALALTPVIVSGGIDLSVGSMMGLSAVIFGMCSEQMPIAAAAVIAVAVGALGGLLNAAIITRLKMPPLIVTLGTYSLFRGLAEGLTEGAKNYSTFPSSFLFLGQGYFFDQIPAQLPVLAAVAVGYWFLLHRTTLGRATYAIGCSAEGARYAGIPVNRRLSLLYVLSGTVAGLAALIYVAHMAQAKADAGTSYELLAITAVVLGGTSIFGGRGTILGTVLGLLAIAVLQKGLILADLRAELAGILVGAVLIGAILISKRRTT
jgi:rhamnose transport system permease protein